MFNLPEGLGNESRQSYHARKKELPCILVCARPHRPSLNGLPTVLSAGFLKNRRGRAFFSPSGVPGPIIGKCSPFSRLGTPHAPGTISSNFCARTASSALWTCAAFPDRGATRNSIERQFPRNCEAPELAMCTCGGWAACATRGAIRRTWAGATRRFEDTPTICKRRNSRRDYRD